MERETRRFKVTAEDGEVYTIIEYRKVVNTAHLGSKEKKEPTETLGKLGRLATAEGHAVKYIDDSTFEIVPLGVMVTIF